MANQEELNKEIQFIEESQAELITNLTVLIAEMTNAFNRFLAKLAAGNDFSSEIQKLSALRQKINDAKDQVLSAIDQAKVEGV